MSYSFGHVYIVHAVGTDRYKIGYTDDHPEDRLRRLQTGSPYQLQLRLSVPCPAPSDVESELHALYAPTRKRGEWFAFTESTLREVRQAMRRQARKQVMNHVEGVLRDVNHSADVSGDEALSHLSALLWHLVLSIDRGHVTIDDAIGAIEPAIEEMSRGASS